MKNKILSFVVYKNEFLALRNKPSKQHGGDFWFVVTGEIENETSEKAVERSERRN